MSNNDKFIRDTPFGKIMESVNSVMCDKCKYRRFKFCAIKTDFICNEQIGYYFAKDETDENKNMQDLQK